MSISRLVAKEEWRFWLRSKLALASAALFLMLLIVTVVITTLRVAGERYEREHHQAEAESTFLAQPDRHPHRMVHYGHYVFRTPAPLAAFDPGLDAVTGQSMFLEGHRQNSATFAASSASADIGGFSTLTPALVYQFFAPLLIILLGHGAIVRERESSTLAPLVAQGVSGLTLLRGKALALSGAIGIMLVPLMASSLMAIGRGEAFAAAFLMIVVYGLYLAVWGLLALLVSVLAKSRTTALTALTALWLAFTLLVPSLAVNNTARALPIPGQLETSLDMLAEMRSLGDGHNAADPAFARLRADLLEEYGVEAVEELPVNLRGVVAEYSEAELTKTLNRYAQMRMEKELAQAELLARHGWLTPVLATAQASRAIAATDLRNYQRFLTEAEALRFDFVQGLNRAHAEALSYSDDINRSNNEEASQRARVDAENWKVLDEFRFEPPSAAARAQYALPSVLALLVWLCGLLAATAWTGSRVRL